MRLKSKDDYAADPHKRKVVEIANPKLARVPGIIHRRWMEMNSRIVESFHFAGTRIDE